MQAIGRERQRAPNGAPVHNERNRPEQTTLYRFVQQHTATFIAETEAAAGADPPQFVKDEFDAFLECGILAHGFLRLRCGDCGQGKLVAFSCKRRGFCPSCGALRMAQTVAHLLDHVIPHVPARQRVLALPIPLCLLLAAQPRLLTPVLQSAAPRRLAWASQRRPVHPRRCAGTHRPAPSLACKASAIGPHGGYPPLACLVRILETTRSRICSPQTGRSDLILNVSKVASISPAGAPTTGQLPPLTSGGSLAAWFVTAMLERPTTAPVVNER